MTLAPANSARCVPIMRLLASNKCAGDGGAEHWINAAQSACGLRSAETAILGFRFTHGTIAERGEPRDSRYHCGA